MRIEIVIAYTAAALNLALWAALFLRLGVLPRRVWNLVQRRSAEDDARALDVLQAAAASRLGGLVVGVQTYHDELVRLARAETAAAEIRARRTDRQASDAAIALDAASALVRDLRALAELLPGPIERCATQIGTGERTTVVLPSGPPPPSQPRPLTAPLEPVDDERISDDELTACQTRPLLGLRPPVLAESSSRREGGAP